jgi:hypothetical protein
VHTHCKILLVGTVKRKTPLGAGKGYRSQWSVVCALVHIAPQIGKPYAFSKEELVLGREKLWNANLTSTNRVKTATMEKSTAMRQHAADSGILPGMEPSPFSIHLLNRRENKCGFEATRRCVLRP